MVEKKGWWKKQLEKAEKKLEEEEKPSQARDILSRDIQGEKRF